MTANTYIFNDFICMDQISLNVFVTIGILLAIHIKELFSNLKFMNYKLK